MKEQINSFYHFLINNRYILVHDNYDCIISTYFLSSLKEKFYDYIVDCIKERGYNRIDTPALVQEDLFFNNLSQVNKYQSLREPALLYFEGKRLKESFILSSELRPFHSLIFKHQVHAHTDLPFKYYSPTISVSSLSIVGLPQKIFELNWLELVSYCNSDGFDSLTQEIQNGIVASILSELKIETFESRNKSSSLFHYKFDNTFIEICSYECHDELETNSKNLSFVDSTGHISHPKELVCRIGDPLFWAFLISHFDDLGFKLPSRFLPFEVVILPIHQSSYDAYINLYILQVERFLQAHNIRFYTDSNLQDTIGERHYKWEKVGIPIRVEIGRKEYECNKVTVINRYSRNRKTINMVNIIEELNVFIDYWK